MIEGRSSRNKKRVGGVTEEKRETWEDCEKKVLEISKDKVEDVTTERANRVKPYRNRKNSKRLT